ncbi:MAG: tRNA lysidine(34) synthetase TilS [Ruminococcus sp.]|nr:tRNA lysidine(34) synthetase TilS [Ruminococcus sp.]
MIMLDKVRSVIEKYDMIADDDRVLVGLSGGADSVCLLLCLRELGIDVSAYHVNHNLRGEESLRDKDFCISLCDSLDIKILTKDIDVTSFCEKNHMSVEEGARELRYNALQSAGFDKIATAHNINDCFETTVFNLARGTGLKGLCSIPPVRGNIIRPLIECTRQEIEQFLKDRSQSFVTDSTNLLDEYTRNKIRHNVIPVLSQINSSLYSSYSSTREYLNDDNDYLEIKANELYKDCVLDKGYDAEKLSAAHNAVASRAVSKLLENEKIEVSALRIRKTLDIIRNSGKYNICNGKYIVCKNGIVFVEDEYTGVGDFCCSINELPYKTTMFGKALCINSVGDFSYSKDAYKKYKGNIADLSKIKGDIILRNRRDGDRVALYGRGFTSKLKTLFNQKIPVNDRDKIFILCDDEGIFYVEGFGIAERVKCDENTKSIINIVIS